jgi:hypothetical protein
MGQASKAVVRAGVVTLVALTSCLAGFLVFRQPGKQPSEGAFLPATQIVSEKEINAAIDGAVNITDTFTKADAQKYMQGLRVKSGGVNFTVLKIAVKETCGKSGCLHVIKNEVSGVAKNLSLVDMPEGKLLGASTQSNCIVVKQPIGGVEESFDICGS